MWALDKSLNQRGFEGSSVSVNEPSRNYCGILKKHLIGHVLRGQNGGSTSWIHESSV